MIKILFALWAMTGIASASYAQKQETDETQSAEKTLVAYFSATGTTARAAEKVARATGGELYAITPAVPYTAADLDWHDKRSRSSAEMNDPQARPAIRDNKIDIADYDVLFIGYPIWWNQAPRIVNTFIENHDLAGMRIVPFATSGSSGIAPSAAALKNAYPDLDWQEGRLLNRLSESDVVEWVGRSGF